MTRIQTFDTERHSQFDYIEEENSEYTDSSDSAIPVEVVIPRKITLFRVIMERKLGVDWEHS